MAKPCRILCRICVAFVSHYVAFRDWRSVGLKLRWALSELSNKFDPAKQKRDFASLESDRLLYVIEIQRLFASLERQGRQGWVMELMRTFWKPTKS